MRVLFTTWAASAHLYNFVPLAWAFVTAGHEVRIASQPALADTLAATGLPGVTLGSDVDVFGLNDRAGGAEKPVEIFRHHPDSLSWDEMRHGYELFRYAMEAFNDPLVDDLVTFARDWRPDLVVWDPLTFAGAVAARACGAADARLLMGLDVWTPMRQRYLKLLQEKPAAQRVDPVGDWLAETLDRFGLAFEEEAVTGRWTIDQLPADLRCSATPGLVPMRYVPINGNAVVPAWLSEPPAAPRICLSLGISRGEFRDLRKITEKQAADIVAALADLDVEVVATLPPDVIDPVPPNTRVVPYVPLHALLPTCAVMVSHAGTGTSSNALLSGVPQVLAPSDFDTPLRAGRLVELGAALTVGFDDITGAEVRDAVRRILADESFQDSARRLRHQVLAEPSPAEVAALLARWTGE
ncbi:activator-dependent family glycosyltransferase [Amycolatopsis taiwanensis]|uniref:Glycosyl transferase n=1 Tax=Amycolatopsis taiwanensis TaxID=342230 RepID=A0A9W6R7E4_9PSEU|nr:activator-dependent family glycosyltransferase [Amycolatopsis taiwanensis]GLY68972.1 glycosyl transferase [Amycolatopsis taiwanensis]